MVFFSRTTRLSFVAARRTMRGLRVTLALAALLGVHASAAMAVGTFIEVPDRVDMEYDDARGILFITTGQGLLHRYHVPSNAFIDPISLGGSLKGIALSPDGRTLLIADQTHAPDDVWIHQLDPDTAQPTRVLFPRAFWEGGTFTVAFGADGAALITSSFEGSGWVPLRRYDPATGAWQVLASVRQDTMLRASADGSVIGFAESNSSAGPVGRYRVADGNLLRRETSGGTNWFNYEIGVSRNGAQYAVPTYDGTFLYDALLTQAPTRIGTYAAGHPIGVVYHPKKDLVYFPWATTMTVIAYDTRTRTPVATYDVENFFDHPGNHAFVEGRLKMSRTGKLLFATVAGGIRFLDLNTPPVAPPQTLTTSEDTSVAVPLAATDADEDPLTYTVLTPPTRGTLSGTAPSLVYTPVPDANGADKFTYEVADGFGGVATATVTIQLAAINDPPRFRLTGETLTVQRGSGPHTVAGWAVDISPGPSDEAGQAVDFAVSTSSPSLFAVRPSLDAAGTLTFTPGKQRGLATVTVIARDSGGTEGGGVNQSSAQGFTIRIK